MAVTQADIDAYERDGVVCLRGVIAPAWIERLREGVAADFFNDTATTEIYTREGDPGLFFNDFDLWRHVPQLKDFILEGPCGEIAGRLMDATSIGFFTDQLFVKEPGTESLTHWHQDHPYMAVEGWQFCSSWIPLDRITADTTLEFVRGSHRWGRFFAPVDNYTDGQRHPGYGYERIPDIEAARDVYDIVSWELKPGDCLFFQARMLHQGRNNPTHDLRRRTLVHRWLGDDARYVLRDPPAEFPKYPTALRSGERFDIDPQFPVVWQQHAGS
jgi:ectoine hydroxylase-related dioxygenase (phytanoyl-CoA dioxygenase family)